MDYETWSPCVETRRVVGDRFKTPWGRTPRDVLGIAMGSHRATLTWQRESAFSYGVEGTTTTLLVEITPKGPATFVERDGSIRCDSQPCMAYDCPSMLLIPVHVKVVTQDGVISVEQDSELAASSGNYIEVSVGQKFATHRGTLRIRDIREKGLVLDGFGISLGFSRKGTMVGEMRGNYEITGVGALFVEYACFPEELPAELRNEENVVGCRG